MKETEFRTEQKVIEVKELFTKKLKENLQLYEVFAPLFVKTSSGLNDDLNGIEKPISFHLKHTKEKYSIVHSLAKWKRLRLTELKIPTNKGLLTQMNAIRPDEDLSHVHSAFVDQWDWEMHIAKADRTLSKLKEVVQKIHATIYATEQEIAAKYNLQSQLKQDLYFIHAEKLLAKYPNLTPKERENAICKKHGSVFIIGIGDILSNGEPHDGRAPDYDDWSTPNSESYNGLNGDILVWSKVLGQALELSSMGIRVDETALKLQCKKQNTPEKLMLPFQKKILNKELVYSIGGGIGRSRIAMFMLQKKHISEVQFLSY